MKEQVSFAQQIESEYYGINRYVSIEGISLEHFSAPTQIETSETPQSHTMNDVFHLKQNDIKQDAVKNIAHTKRIIEFLKQGNIMSNILSTIWVNKYCFAKHHICSTKSYMILILS